MVKTVKHRTHAITRVVEDHPETNSGADQSIEFGERNLRLGWAA